MKRLVLHIGHSKCASSTLQGYLTKNPILDKIGENKGVVRYIATNMAGKIIQGEAMMQAALVGNVFDFTLSDSDLLSNPALFASVLSQIAQISGPDDTVVLSSEAWGNDSFVTPKVHQILNSAPLPIDVFMLTRPAVDWVNAAWWQWGAWMDAPSIDALTPINFLKVINAWRQISRVENICVHDISQGPIPTFLDFVGAIGPAQDTRLNVATDYDLLRHLIRNRAHYGRNSANPTVEFQLNGLILGQRRPLPIVVSRPVAQAMIRRDQADNAALVALFQRSGHPIAPDVIHRYLDPSAYDHLPEQVDIAASFDADYADGFVKSIMDALLATQVKASAFDAIQTFDPVRYLTIHPDVRAAGMNPYEHFMRFGIQEGRKTQ